MDCVLLAQWTWNTYYCLYELICDALRKMKSLFLLIICDACQNKYFRLWNRLLWELCWYCITDTFLLSANIYVSTLVINEATKHNFSNRIHINTSTKNWQIKMEHMISEITSIAADYVVVLWFSLFVTRAESEKTRA